MRNLLSTVCVSAVLAFAAPAFADDYVLMKVNSQDITQSQAMAAWQSHFPQGQAPALDSVKPQIRDNFLRGIMAENILLTEANKAGVDKSPEVEKQLAELKKKLVVKSFIEQKTADAVKEADIKREYDSYVSTLRDEKEVHARHILVASEKEAKDVKAKLAEGKSFEEVARDYSKDPGSAKEGGDLGYFTKDKMVKEFAEAAFKLKKGEVSDPVQSPFGWHIIKIEDVRKVTPPTYNEAKASLRAQLQEKKLDEYIRGLVKSADVKLYDEKGKELPFSKNIPDAPKAK